MRCLKQVHTTFRVHSNAYQCSLWHSAPVWRCCLPLPYRPGTNPGTVWWIWGLALLVPGPGPSGKNTYRGEEPCQQYTSCYYYCPAFRIRFGGVAWRCIQFTRERYVPPYAQIVLLICLPGSFIRSAARERERERERWMQ